MAQFTPLPETEGAFVVGNAVLDALLGRPVNAPVWFTGDLDSYLKGQAFTLNALAVSTTGELIDPYAGLLDVQRKQLRLLNRTTLLAEPLSPLQAVRLAANLGFELEAETGLILKTMVAAQQNGERVLPAPVAVAQALNSILLSARAGQGFLLLEELGLLALYLPELAVARATEQGGYHHLDVLGHSLEALNQLVQGFPEADLALRWATLLHDVGKPATKTYDETGKHYHFYGHDKLGSIMTRDILQRFEQPVTLVDRASALVRYHMLPLPKNTKAARRLVQRRAELLPDLLQLMLADREAARGRLSSAASRTAYRLAVARVLAVLAEPPPAVPLLTGQDIMLLLNLNEGPDVGKAIRFLAESEAVGDATTRAEAVELLQRYAKQQLTT